MLVSAAGGAMSGGITPLGSCGTQLLRALGDLVSYERLIPPFCKPLPILRRSGQRLALPLFESFLSFPTPCSQLKTMAAAHLGAPPGTPHMLAIGGAANAGAALLTTPFDVVKVTTAPV